MSNIMPLFQASKEAHSPLLPIGDIIQSHPEHTRAPHKETFAEGSAYINGQLCPLSQAAIPITDLGFMRADAVYDVVSVSRGAFFRLDRHIDRFEESCRRIRLKNPYTKEKTAEILQQLVNLTGLKDARVWWGVTRGAIQASSTRLYADAFENRFYAFAMPYLFLADQQTRQKGADIIISKHHTRISPQSVDPRAKNFQGLDFGMSLFEAGDRNADWSVLTDGLGHIAEAPAANIFVINQGLIVTPSEWCLHGITRQTVLDLCYELSIDTEQRRIPIDELRHADEAFLTSTTGGITPINSVDGEVLGGKPGPGELTVRLHNLYWEKRWSGWESTPVEYGIG